MLKHLLMAGVAGALVLGGALATASVSHAQDKKLTFAVVPKALNNPFYDQAKAGCEKAAAELGDVECYFTGPGEHGGGDEQAQIIADLLAKGVDGIAVSPSNAAAIAAVIRDGNAAKTPILTFDSDLLPEDASLRIAYVGTHNYEIGSNLAKLVMKVKPNGGTVCIQSGGAAAANHNERMQGIRDTLGGLSGTEPPGTRLTGQNGWTEVDGCPLYTNDDFPLAVQQEGDILNKYADLDAFIPTGGFAQFLPDANAAMIAPFKDRIASGKLALAVADTLPMQIDALKAGLASGNVGQRPFEMGYESIKFLKDIHDGKAPPKDPTYTGLDVCTPDNAATCVGGGS
jgi:ribose transport system substrate-binding protein